jgi:hypothetical protein
VSHRPAPHAGDLFRLLPSALQQYVAVDAAPGDAAASSTATINLAVVAAPIVRQSLYRFTLPQDMFATRGLLTLCACTSCRAGGISDWLVPASVVNWPCGGFITCRVGSGLVNWLRGRYITCQLNDKLRWLRGRCITVPAVARPPGSARC